MRSTWCCVALAAALAACGTEDDQRPLTLEVVTLTVLAPNCGQVQCHSTFTTTEGLAFDTVKAARASLMTPAIRITSNTDPNNNDLMDVLEGVGGKERMPPDAPLADDDITLIVSWIQAGAPGL